MEESGNKAIMGLEPLNMEACRICLATDVKMYSLNDPYLASCMKDIGLNDESRQWLPKYICYECRPTLIKCNKLIEKSKVAEDILFGLYNKSHSQVIRKELIKEQHRFQIKLQSPLKCYLSQDYYYIKHDDDEITLNNEVISKEKVKDEPDDFGNIGLMEILARCVPMRLISPLSDDRIESPSPQKEPHRGRTSESIYPAQEVQFCTNVVPKEMSDDQDNDVVAIEEELPVVEIISDDEKTDDDPIPDLNNTNGLIYLDVNKDVVSLDEAKDHYVLGCPKRNARNSSSSLSPSSGVKIWQEWPGSS
ncbi:hypothetical protein HF086_011540 [Spodoptera exigua]|uniref:ZAD domain-containing protein n=1 Tax=Spodoptera exigua TaxID=7107 RepID=A0A922SE38_SPOEX|nr:hypothetical protein HF086_011540 [Spodoptera exigua]